MASLQETKKNSSSHNFKGVTPHVHKAGAIVALGLFIFVVSISMDVMRDIASSQKNVAAAVAYASKCENNADVTIGFGGLGTGLMPGLSNGVYGPTKATPGGKYYGCMLVACRDTVGRAARYVQQQAQAAGRTITVDIMGHSAGADGSIHLARRLAAMPNVKVRRIVAADATAFAGRVPSNVGHVINLNSNWNNKSPLIGDSPIQYVNRGDLDHFGIDDAIPQHLHCLSGESPCKTGKEEQCKNRCSTTYTQVDNGSPKVVDCYGKGEDKAKKAVEDLVQCVAENTEGVAGATAIKELYEKLLPDFEKGMSTEQWGEGVQKNKPSDAEGKETITKKGNYFAIVSTLPLIVYPLKTPPVPEACFGKYKVVLGIIGAYNGDQSAAQFASSATKDDVAKCAWKGAVVCYPDTQNADKLICKKKLDLAQNNSKEPASNTTQCVLNNRNDPEAIKKCLSMEPSGPVPPGTTGLTGSPFGNQSNTQQAFGGQQQQCPQGHKQSTSGGKTVCLPDGSQKKKDEEAAAKPECLLVANKEKIAAGEPVILQWRTANAEKVSLAPVKESVEKSGRTTHSPDKTTTYKLLVQGKGSTKKTCEATVEVDGVAGKFSDENKPLIGCSPDLVERGGVAKILWACADGSNTIESEGFDANDRLKGEVAVRPRYNTTYEVMCSRDDSLVGKNQCAVRVGKPEFDIIAEPTHVQIGERVRISWGSLFMESCRVQGPRGFDYTRTRGVVLTEPFMQTHVQNGVRSTKYKIMCKTKFGDTVSGEVTVRLAQ